MPNPELHGERINQAYQLLAAHKGIRLVFLLSILLRVIIPIFLPNIASTTLLYVVETTLCILLPILLFFQLKGEVIKTILGGTLSYKRAIVIGSIVGIISIAITLSNYVFIDSILVHFGLPAFQGKGALEVLKMTLCESLKDSGVSFSFSMLLWQVPFMYILGPFGEEIVFQGWLQTKLLKKMGPIKAALGASAIFVLVHRSINPFTFVVLLLFALIRMRTGSLLCCSIAHAVGNFGFTIICFVLGVRN